MYRFKSYIVELTRPNWTLEKWVSCQNVPTRKSFTNSLFKQLVYSEICL